MALAAALALLAGACTPSAPEVPTAEALPTAAAVAPEATLGVSTEPTAPSNGVPVLVAPSPTLAQTAPLFPPSLAGSPAASPSPAAVPSPGTGPSPSPSPLPSPVLSVTGRAKIVSSLPRTGIASVETQEIVNGIQMALDEVNGRIGNATIRYEDLDDATPARSYWDPEQEEANARQAVADEEVVAYIGTFNSAAAKVSIPLTCRGNLAMISPTNTYAGLTKEVEGVEPNEPEVYYEGCTRNYARVIPSDDVQGAVAAEWARSLGASSVYVLHDGDPYGVAVASTFNSTAARIGLSVVGGPEPIDPRAASYGTLAGRIREAGADTVFFAGISQNNAVQLWRDLRATLGSEVRLMGPDGLYDQAFVELAGQAAEGTHVVFNGVPARLLTGKGAQWAEAYRRRFGREPGVFAAYGYEAASVVLDAIRRADSLERERVRDALLATRDFEGVLGQWSFDENGDTTFTGMSGRVIRDGALVEGEAVRLSASR